MEFLLVFHKIFPYSRGGSKNAEDERDFGKIMFSQFVEKRDRKSPALAREGWGGGFFRAGDFLIPRC